MNEEPRSSLDTSDRPASGNGVGPASDGHGFPPRESEGISVSEPDEQLSPAAHPTFAPTKRGQLLGGAWELVETLILAALFFFALRAVVQNFRVEGSSMYPNFSDGQYVLVNKAVYWHVAPGSLPGWVPIARGGTGQPRFLFHPPERGAVIVFHPPPPNDPTRDFIKRVVAVPGDTVDVRDGRLFVNGAAVLEPYIHEATLPLNVRFTHVALGPDQYYVLGDNRTNSSDSRAWGPISADEIVGRTWLVYWPLNALKVAPNHTERVPAAAAAAP